RTAVKQLSQEYISVELLDLISISPLDYAGIEASVRKTKRLLIVDTSWKTSGISSTISAEISRRLFNQLKAPIEILTVPDCPVPTAANLEAAYYPSVESILDSTRHLVKI
ncbi:MAG: transketolase C-terminal domain-containing protein, partial [Deltaproteobacteria bacterium]